MKCGHVQPPSHRLRGGSRPLLGGTSCLGEWEFLFKTSPRWEGRGSGGTENRSVVTLP